MYHFISTGKFVIFNYIISLAFSMFNSVYNHKHYLVSEYFLHPKGKLAPIKQWVYICPTPNPQLAS